MADDCNEALVTLADLPESCLSKILELTTPKDVCRLSVLCCALKSAGNSNCVWEKMLPPCYRDLLARASNPLQFNSKKELYFRLCEPVFIDQRKKKFWLDKATGKICFMFSARDLGIVWGNDTRYWRWISGDGASFDEVAKLIKVCWFEVEGSFDCRLLSPGIAYTVSFRLKLNGLLDGWDITPVKFSVTTSWGHQQQSARFFQNTEEPVEHVGEDWIEFDAGEFVVEENDDGPKEVKFKMNEVVGGDWKDGLILDGVKIQPSFLVTDKREVREE
ncbi:F-box protein At2g02240 isoform X2 [Cryptomeria japonica]|uniref:F-box protein At2g02240 isoform X2 n=1 Tax=Cryptomeria japonica TaxID=3369 RepID=UPI0027DAA31C|nr:F-box protein At2g02240 isoform X2 [Cryptomeria japonica]